MKRCDLCGLPSAGDPTFHAACARALFGSVDVPTIDMSLDDVAVEAHRMAGRMSISGVQPKLSVTRRGRQLMAVESDGRYILKPQTQSFRHLPENENLCINMAAQLGIEVPPHGLFRLRDETWAYVIRRFDRTPDGEKRRCEDFAQILGKEKYSGSHEQLGRRLREISEFPGLDAQLFFERVLFSYLIGNGDAHLKNYSVLETDAGRLRLSPAYDMVCSRLLIPREDDCALTINGKHNKVGRGDFAALAERLKIPDKAHADIMARLESIRAIASRDVPDSYMPPDDQDTMLQIIESRWSKVYGQIDPRP
jgi:serine/threonine-protein kinase HipA